MPADSVYGFAFSIDYNALNVDSATVKIDYSNSWLGNKTNSLSLYKDFPDLGKVDLAFTRIDKQNITGYGKVGEMSCVLEDNLSGKDTIYVALDFGISNVRVISSDETEIPVNTLGDSLIAVGPTASIFEEDLTSKQIYLYPNPAADKVELVLPSPASYTIVISDCLGKKLKEIHTQNEAGLLINTTEFVAGTYFVEAFTEDRKYKNIKKLMIVNSK